MPTKYRWFRSAAGIAGAILLAIAGDAAAQVFKWTDSEGHVHYGDRPPGEAAAKAIATPSPGFTPGQDVEIEETEYRYFEVNGATVEELNRGREAFGVSGISIRDGKPFKSWANCGWHLRWNVTRSKKDDGQCHVEKFKVKLVTYITLPKWGDKSDAPPDLQKKWDTFVRVVHTHELGHKQNNVRAANEMTVEIHKLSPQPDCATVDAKVQTLYGNVVTKYKLLNNAWDQAQVNGSEEDYYLR
jgi:predicted secreted Zn-dependent protease